MSEGWTVLDRRRLVAADPHLAVDVETVALPDGRVVDDYYKVWIPDFVLIYARSRNGKVIVERQYKHALGRLSLTLPSGRVEPGETPVDAAQRELLEETGYIARDWQILGSFVVNGNQGCGTAYIATAQEAVMLSSPSCSDLEDIAVLPLPETELRHAVFSGAIGLLGHAAAVSMVQLAERPEN